LIAPSTKLDHSPIPLSQRPEADTQRITYSLRAKSRSRIKGNFATWTRLGLFTISTPTRVARKLEYEPALLDTQADDVHATLGGLPASTIDVTPPTETPIPN
jgi:hypothetical protein